MKTKGLIVGIVAPGTVDTEDYMNAEDPSTVPLELQDDDQGQAIGTPDGDR